MHGPAQYIFFASTLYLFGDHTLSVRSYTASDKYKMPDRIMLASTGGDSIGSHGRENAVKRHSYRERDYAFGQLMVTLRTHLGLTQGGLGDLLVVSRRAVAQWEGGLAYPKAEHLKALLALGVRNSVFPVGHEAEDIRAFWRAAHQKVLLDEAWLHDLLSPRPPVPVLLFSQAETLVAHLGKDPAASLPCVDWVGALDVSHFAGREMEVAELAKWIVQERCRMVTVLSLRRCPVCGSQPRWAILRDGK